jgi:hypothetical protein
MVTWEALTLETTAGTGFADKVNDVSCRCSFKSRAGKLDLILAALDQNGTVLTCSVAGCVDHSLNLPVRGYFEGG